MPKPFSRLYDEIGMKIPGGDNTCNGNNWEHGLNEAWYVCLIPINVVGGPTRSGRVTCWNSRCAGRCWPARSLGRPPPGPLRTRSFPSCPSLHPAEELVYGHVRGVRGQLWVGRESYRKLIGSNRTGKTGDHERMKAAEHASGRISTHGIMARGSTPRFVTPSTGRGNLTGWPSSMGTTFHGCHRRRRGPVGALTRFDETGPWSGRIQGSGGEWKAEAAEITAPAIAAPGG